MPTTDLMDLSTPEIKKEFTDLFAFAKTQGAVQETSRPHYTQRFAADPFATRREIDQLISGAKYAEMGTAAAHIVVHDLPGYPSPSADSPTAYPESWT